MTNASGVGACGYRHDCGSSGLRKAKKQRIPKRGPGVAELEKILREQEQKGNGIGGISSSSSSLVPSLPVPAVHGNGNGSSRLGCGNVGATYGGSKGIYIGGSVVFLPEQTLLPISWGSCSSGTSWKHGEAPKMTTGLSFAMLVSNVSAPPPPLLQKNHHHSTMNLFPLSATAKTTPPSSAGVYRHIEPPSNQKPSHHNYISSLFPEEDKIMNTKRTRPSFPIENWRPAPPRMPFQPFRPQVSRLELHPLSSANSNGVFNFGMSRDQGNPSGNSSRPTTIQNCQPDLSKFNKQYPFHENTEGTLQQRSSESDVPVYNKGFFSLLLQPEELQRGNTSAESTPCLQTEMCCSEKTGEFIDLNLKL